jgi:hypothetical protein
VLPSPGAVTCKVTFALSAVLLEPPQATMTKLRKPAEARSTTRAAVRRRALIVSIVTRVPPKKRVLE